MSVLCKFLAKSPHKPNNVLSFSFQTSRLRFSAKANDDVKVDSTTSQDTSKETSKESTSSFLDQFNLISRSKNRIFIGGYAPNFTYIAQASGDPTAHKGPLVLLPDLALSWKGVTDFNNIFDLEKYSILKVIPNIILLGVGESFNFDEKALHFAQEFKKKYKIPLDIMKTSSAAGTFNFLNEEERGVVGFFYPM